MMVVANKEEEEGEKGGEEDVDEKKTKKKEEKKMMMIKKTKKKEEKKMMMKKRQRKRRRRRWWWKKDKEKGGGKEKKKNKWGVTIVARAWSFTTPSLWAPNSSKLLFNLPNLTWLGSSWGLIPKALKGSQFGPPFFFIFFFKSPELMVQEKTHYVMPLWWLSTSNSKV